MDYHDSKRKETEIIWLMPEIKQYFLELHSEYWHNTRKHVIDEHPYYFVNEKQGSSFGHPATLSNMIKAFYRAAKRVGLSPNDDGVNPHGARHFYGYFSASHLRLPIEITQINMHHKNIESTRVYYALDKATVRDEIRKGYERIAKELPVFCSSAASLLNKK
jgi:integrase